LVCNKLSESIMHGATIKIISRYSVRITVIVENDIVIKYANCPH